MQSYTVEEPSEALINFTLSSTSDDLAETSLPAHNSSKKSDAVHKHDSTTNSTEKSSIKLFKSRIPTPKSTNTLLSKCHFDTPSPAVEKGESEAKRELQINNRPFSTPVNAARHRQFVRLVNQKVLSNRSLTPTPPSRAMTPTPPSRPRSELGTQYTRSRSHSRGRDRSTRGLFM